MDWDGIPYCEPLERTLGISATHLSFPNKKETGTRELKQAPAGEPRKGHTGDRTEKIWLVV